MSKMKIIRACTVAQSVGFFVGLIPELREMGYEVVAVSSDGPRLERVRDAGSRVEAVQGVGILFSHGDSAQLAREILALETDTTRYHAIAEACRHRADNFDISAMATSYSNLYKSL